jgi:hypothetical protein
VQPEFVLAVREASGPTNPSDQVGKLLLNLYGSRLTYQCTEVASQPRADKF